MQIVTREIPYKSRSDKFVIVPLGDIHLGNAGCDLEKFKETIEEIKENKNYLWIGMGDYLDCINIQDPRFDPYSIDPRYNIKSLSNLIKTQAEDILELLKPIKKKCLGLLVGNHEENIRLRYYVDVGIDLARELETVMFGYSGYIKLIFCRKEGYVSTFSIYANHGCGSSRKSGAKVNRLEDTAHSWDADIIVLAHEHKKIIAPPILKLGVNKANKLVQKKQFAVMSGSFLKGYVEDATSYVEKKLYNPTDLGTVKLIITPDKLKIEALS